MRVVVTGAAGFIGSHVCETLLDRGEQVLGIDALTDSYDPDLKRRNYTGLLVRPEFEFLARRVDGLNLTAVLAGADAVCHLAGSPGVRSADGHRLETDNVGTTETVVRAAVQARVPRVVLTSSSSVYAPTRWPVDEDALLAPVSCYGRSKLRAERLATALAGRHLTEVVVLRLFTVYGPRQRPDMAFARFIAAAQNGGAMTVYGNGHQRRDFTYVGDAVDAILLALERGRPGGVYNVSGGRSVTLAHALELLAGGLGEAPPVDLAPFDRREHFSTAADINRAIRDLGYAPQVPLEQGIAQQVAADWCGVAGPPLVAAEPQSGNGAITGRSRS
jgi:UDP-glucuronate 4-epimerase